MGADWQPTHTIPDGGLTTWSAPDASKAADNFLAAGLDVQLVVRQADWARVRCNNDWSAWVIASHLMALRSRETPSGGGVTANGASTVAPSGPPTNVVIGPATAPPDSSHTPTNVTNFFDHMAKPGNGLVAGAVALIVGIVPSYLLWPILAIPGKILKDAIPRGNCRSETPGTTAMYFCSVKAGTLTALGPFLTLVVALSFRQPLAAQLRKLTSRLPTNSTALVTPVVATAMFTMVHAAVHDKTADQTGLVPQRMFPALIGLFTFAAGRAAPAVARRYGGAIDRRNRAPIAVRVVVALAVPLASSYFLTNQNSVTDTALKEQLVALLTLGTSYAALVPRDGDFLGATQRFLASRAQLRLGRKRGSP